MKKVLIFIAGVVIGAILMLVIAALIGNSSNGESSNNGMTFFELSLIHISQFIIYHKRLEKLD